MRDAAIADTHHKVNKVDSHSEVQALQYCVLTYSQHYNVKKANIHFSAYIIENLGVAWGQGHVMRIQELELLHDYFLCVRQV